MPGLSAPSDIELRVIDWLTKHKFRYMYQYVIGGGASLRGTVIIDFVIFDPFPVPLELFGDYWHISELNQEERLRMARIEQAFGREPVILWGNELENDDEVDRAMNEHFGGAL